MRYDHGMPEPSHRGARRPRGEREETRKEILRAAVEVFGAHGYTNGSLQEIGEKVGMTHSGILHHFGSKNDLLLEVLRYRDESDLEDVEGQTVPRDAELFRHLMRTVRMNAGRPGVVQTYAVLSADSVTDGHPAKTYFADRFVELRGNLVAAIGSLRPDDPPSEQRIHCAANAIIGAMDGLQVQWLLDPDSVDLVESTRFAINAILSDILDDPPDRLD